MAKPESMKMIHERLRAAYRNQWDAAGEADRLVKDELRSMCTEFGEQRTAKGVTDFIRSVQFFSIASLRECVTRTSTESKAKHLYDEHCGNCEEGWEVVPFNQMELRDQEKCIRNYGLDAARTLTARRRCRQCWKSASAIEVALK